MAGQLTARDVEAGLSAAGFERQPQGATAHVKWVKELAKPHNGQRRLVVTVSAHLAPFSKTLIRNMATQAGISVKQFHELCSNKGCKAAKRGELPWLPV